MGAALRQIQPLSWAFVASGALLLFATAASPKHSHRLIKPVSMHTSPPAGTRQPSAARHAAPKPHIPTAESLYLKSLHADKLYSYRGRQVTTYWRPGRSESVIVSHRAPNLRRIDYLAPDIERGRCIVITGTQQWQYDPRSKQLLHRRIEPGEQAAADAAASYDLLRTNYIVGVERSVQNSANRKVFVLTITRKSNRTLARKLWIDAATGLALKRENYGFDGKMALTETYSDINYHVKLPLSLFDLSAIAHRPGVKLIEEPASGESPLKLSAVKSALGGAARAPSVLNGYRLISASLTHNGRHEMLHLRYSDGLNLVSLSEQRRIDLRRPTRVPKSMRRTLIGRRQGHIERLSSITTLNWDTRLLNVTLVSEVGEATLRSLASAVDSSARR